MQYEYLKLDVPNSNTEGTAKAIERHRVKSVYVTGTFDATVTIEISPSIKLPLDDFDWYPVGVPVVGADAPKVQTFEHACMWIRVSVSNYTSGKPEVSFGGYDVV